MLTYVMLMMMRNITTAVWYIFLFVIKIPISPVYMFALKMFTWVHHVDRRRVIHQARLPTVPYSGSQKRHVHRC